MWTRLLSYLYYCSQEVLKYLKDLIRLRQVLFVSLLSMILVGCSSLSSVETVKIPSTPVLLSVKKVELDGEPGVWMNSQDASTLVQWIYDIEGLYK